MSEMLIASQVIEIIDNLAPETLHTEASGVCTGKNWYFGNRSSDEHSVPFWKMDLDATPVFNAIWEAAKARCEELAGRKLRVVRQYANGHTYGLGGQPHRDDERPGTFTLLYYPMAEWKPEWQGETVFHDEAGEIALSLLPKPNRAVFFDARIPHAGRAPSRTCPALRVTVAFKLEAVETASATAKETVGITELKREGPRRVYCIRVGAEHLSSLIGDRLQELGKTVRLPGFRAGKIPAAVLQSRYGARTRDEIVSRTVNQSVEQILAGGGLPESIQLMSGVDSIDVEFHLMATHLPDLPEVDCREWQLESLSASHEAAEAANLSIAEAEQLLNQDLHQQVLDRLDAAYPFPVATPLVERELESIRQAAQAQLEDGGQAAVLTEFREVAERRVRLGAVIAELARRHQLPARGGSPTLESRVIEWLISRSRVIERPATSDELSALN